MEIRCPCFTLLEGEKVTVRFHQGLNMEDVFVMQATIHATYLGSYAKPLKHRLKEIPSKPVISPLTICNEKFWRSGAVLSDNRMVLILDKHNVLYRRKPA